MENTSYQYTESEIVNQIHISFCYKHINNHNSVKESC